MSALFSKNKKPCRAYDTTGSYWFMVFQNPFFVKRNTLKKGYKDKNKRHYLLKMTNNREHDIF